MCLPAKMQAISLTAADFLPQLLQQASLRLSLFAAADSPGQLQTADELDIAALRGGHQDAFDGIVARHQAHVARMMWRFTRDRELHAELVQDVFVEAWRSLGSYRGQAPLRHWLSRIATRCGYAHWRKREQERQRGSHELPDSLPAARAGAGDAVQMLYALLQQLAPADRLVLVLRYIEGLDQRETARLTGWNETLVRVRALRARRRLAKLLDGQDLQI